MPTWLNYKTACFCIKVTSRARLVRFLPSKLFLALNRTIPLRRARSWQFVDHNEESVLIPWDPKLIPAMRQLGELARFEQIPVIFEKISSDEPTLGRVHGTE